MKHPSRRLAVFALALAACGDPPPIPVTGGPIFSDGGGPAPDDGAPPDAGVAPRDAGTDSGGPIDSGYVPRDSGTGNCASRPVLQPGVWKNITPAGLNLPVAPPPYGLAFVEIDPSDPCTLYVTADMAGIWRTKDGGSTWARLGDPAKMGDTTTSYLDSAITVKVDPDDPKHLYATQGVRGKTLGFWVSNDGGETWSQPAGFVSVSKTTTIDVTTLAVDPADFRHVLLGSHSAWPNMTNAGILETKDGGATFIVHPPIPEFNSGSMGINFLYDPAHGRGDSRTWLVGTDGNGLFRTTDSGATFTRVTPTTGWPNFSISHGGQQLYYASNGTIYIGAFVYPAYSTDNGLSWKALDTLPYASYYSVVGDGKTLYTQVSFTGDNGGHGQQPYYVSPESDGTHWAPYDPLSKGPQTFADGPFVMRFDAANRILYSANWDSGLWALKVMP